MRMKTQAQKQHYMRNKFGFWFIRTLISSVLFLLAYFFWITNWERNGISFVYILGVVSGSSVIGTTIGMIISRKSNLSANVQGYLKTLFNWLFTTLILWIGFWTYAWDTMNVWVLFIVFLGIRGMIYYISDYYADQILFQGGK